MNWKDKFPKENRYYENSRGILYQGHVLDVLKTLPDESVDLIITSPPYWGLRDYSKKTYAIWGGDPNCNHEWVDTGKRFSKPNHGNGSKVMDIQPVVKDAQEKEYSGGYFCKKCSAWYGQLGLEPTLDLYIEHILQITAELQRVLKKTGQFWLNIGDCYGSHTFGSSKKGGGIQKKMCQEEGAFPRYSNKSKVLGDKCLGMIPERLAIRMIDEQGWILRNKVKWAKMVLIKKENRTIGNAMPTSVKDRFNESGEEFYFFVKNRKYWSDIDAVRLPIQTSKIQTGSRTNKKEWRNKTKQHPNARGLRQAPEPGEANAFHPLGKNLPTIWQINLEPHNFKKELGTEAEHFAVFPSALLEIPIKFGCPKRSSKNFELKPAGWEAGIVLDPFVGSGTTAVVAEKLGRNWIGIELNPEYCEIAVRRIRKIAGRLFEK